MLVHGADTAIAVAGQRLTRMFRAADVSPERELHDVTCFGADGHEWQPGLMTGGLSFDGFFDATLDDVLVDMYFGDQDAQLTPKPEPWIVGQQGLAANSDPVVFGAGWTKAVKRSQKSTDMITAALELQSHDGMWPGLYVTGVVADTSGSWIVFDRGAAAVTANQRIAVVTSAAYLPAGAGQYYTLYVDHSADNVSYASLRSAGVFSPAIDGRTWGKVDASDVSEYSASHGVLAYSMLAATINRYIRFRVDRAGFAGTHAVDLAVAVF